MIRNGVGELNSNADVDEIFNNDPVEEHAQIQLPQDKLSKRRQVEDLLEKKRLRAELDDF